MNLYPLEQCARQANEIRKQTGASFHQQFICMHCKTKQTIATPNLFYRRGQCEECNKVTNIEKDGCNYLIVMKGKDDVPF